MAIQTAGQKTAKITKIRVENQATFPLPKDTEDHIGKVLDFIPMEQLRGIEKVRLVDFISDPRLKKYEFYLNDIDRRAQHTLSDKEEALLAMAGPLGGVPSNVYGILSNADFPYPTVTLSDGKSIVVNQANFGAYRSSPNRADRETVMAAFFNALGKFAHLRHDHRRPGSEAAFYAKARKYNSSMEPLAAPTSITVYTRCGRREQNLSTFHRYLNLARR